MLLGSVLSGGAVDYFTGPGGVHNWKPFWLSSSAMAAVILLMILVGFRTDEKIRPKEVSA